MPVPDLQFASDLIARLDRLKPSTRQLREKIMARIVRKGELPSTKSIGYWRNYIAAVQMQCAKECAPWMDAARAGDPAALAIITKKVSTLRKVASDRPPISERKPRQGRVKSLSSLSEGWQESVYQALSEKWRPAFAVMALTGCRPAELDGLEIRPTGQEGVLTFRIEGRKVTEKAGQAWRELTIDVRGTSYGQALIAEIGVEGGKVEIKNTAQAVTKAVTRAAQRAKLIRMNQTLPGYACRNAMASAMKAECRDITEVAGALGHSTDECQKFYGRAVCGHKGGGSKILEVKTARPVRETARSLGYQAKPES